MKVIGSARKLGLSALSMFGAIIMFVACQNGPPHISISGAKAELSPSVVGEAIITMNIGNEGGSDVLKGVKSDIPGANASFHVMQDERMVHVDTVKVPAKNSLEFKMGGSHIMIEDMPKTMKEGSHINLLLVFQKAGEKQILLTLQGAAAMPGDHEHHM